MLAFFEGIFSFFQTIMTLIISLLSAFWEMLITIKNAVLFVTSLVSYLPAFVQTAALACLGISVIYLIINHGGN